MDRVPGGPAGPPATRAARAADPGSGGVPTDAAPGTAEGAARAPAGAGARAWALVAPHRDRLVTVARARGLSLPDAQDVAHHVLCRAVERGGLDRARVDAFLDAEVAARCDGLRAEAARDAALLARTPREGLVEPPDDAVCDRALLAWLLSRLPARERVVVTLSAAGETVTGIAARTGLSYATVDRLLTRARRELRRLARAAR